MSETQETTQPLSGQATAQQTIIIQNASSAMGIASFIFGLISIFMFSILFVPLSLLFGVIGIIKKQFIWSSLGIVFAIIGFMTSPVLLGMLGMASAASAS